MWLSWSPYWATSSGSFLYVGCTEHMFFSLVFCLFNLVLSLPIQNPLGPGTQRGNWVKMLFKMTETGLQFSEADAEMCFVVEVIVRKKWRFDHWEIRWHCLSCCLGLALYSVSSISLLLLYHNMPFDCVWLNTCSFETTNLKYSHNRFQRHCGTDRQLKSLLVELNLPGLQQLTKTKIIFYTNIQIISVSWQGSISHFH